MCARPGYRVAMLLALVLAVQTAAPEEHGAEPAIAVPLSDVYARPEFAASRHRTRVTLKVLLSRLQTWLESLFETSGAQTYSNVTRIAVLVVALLVAGWAGLRLRSRRRSASPGQGPTDPSPLQLEAPTAHLTRAKRLLDSDPREAIRQGLYGLLSLLEQRRWARPDRVKTNRELSSELPTRGAPQDLAATVTSMLGWYDVAFYSRAPVTRPDAERFINDVDSLGL